MRSPSIVRFCAATAVAQTLLPTQARCSLTQFSHFGMPALRREIPQAAVSTSVVVPAQVPAHANPWTSDGSTAER